jgi:hypothetical protein
MSAVVIMAYHDLVTRPSLGAFVANFRDYDAPLATKIRMVLRNNAIKLRTRQSCCGHPGEPGC